MILTQDNYFSVEANQTYMSVSQFKSFVDCEARALAEANGEYERPMSKAFLEGAFVDSHFNGSTSEFLSEHPEVVNRRTGELKSDFTKARAAIEVAENSEMFMEFLSGARQTVLTGELFGVRWKAKPDFLTEDRIVDLKYMKDMLPVWKDGEKKPFVDAYGYDIQGYVYQQLVFQKTGKMLPFFLAVITKEDPADLAIIQIPQWRLNGVSGMIAHYVERYTDIKNGKLQPERCCNCAYCRATKVLKEITKYEDLLEM